MIKELKEFCSKANVLDLAVAVVMGTAFNAIVTSFVNDVITPLFLTPALKSCWCCQKSPTFLGMVLLMVAF